MKLSLFGPSGMGALSVHMICPDEWMRVVLTRMVSDVARTVCVNVKSNSARIGLTKAVTVSNLAYLLWCACAERSGFFSSFLARTKAAQIRSFFSLNIVCLHAFVLVSSEEGALVVGVTKPPAFGVKAQV